jgi:hypothetical protein
VVTATKVKRSITRRLKRTVILPGDTVATSAKRITAFVVGWGAFLALILWGGYHQGWLHGVGDGFILGAVFTVVAVLLGRNAITPVPTENSVLI